MSLSSTVNKTIFACTGGTTYDFLFKVFEPTDIEVVLITIATSAETILTYTTHYSVSMLTDTGGRVTTVAAYSALYQLVVRRAQPQTQDIDYTQNDELSTEVLEEQLDKIVMMIQDLQESLTRAILQNAAAITAITFPLPVTNYYLMWNAAGQLVSSPGNGAAGPTGPAGPGDVNGPAANSADYVPQWDGVNSKLLKNGLAVGTAANNLVQLTAAAKYPAVDGSLITNLTATIPPATNTNNNIPQWDGADSKTLKNGLALGGANGLVQLTGAGALPALDGSALTGIVVVGSGRQVFTASGNFTAPAGVTRVYLSGCAGGGGGGGAEAGGGGMGGGGGGGGGYVVKYPYTVIPANVYAVTINAGGAGGARGTPGTDGAAGGTTVFDAFTLPGGGGGKEGNVGTGGAGGGGLTGVAGGAAPSVSLTSGTGGAKAATIGGSGGNTPFGKAGDGGNATSGGDGIFGAGGGGGGNAVGAAGGAGGNGILIVEY